jgi:hypothetical protein
VRLLLTRVQSKNAIHHTPLLLQQLSSLLRLCVCQLLLLLPV